MKELVSYLLQNLYLDFQGEISVEQVREFLREDESREARQLLSKIIEEKGIDDLLIHIEVTNRGPEAAECHVLPTLWFRNTWSWEPGRPRPRLAAVGPTVVEADHDSLGLRWLVCGGAPRLLFTENETNFQRLYGAANRTPYVKDGINACVVEGREAAVHQPSRRDGGRAWWTDFRTPGRRGRLPCPKR